MALLRSRFSPAQTLSVASIPIWLSPDGLTVLAPPPITMESPESCPVESDGAVVRGTVVEAIREVVPTPVEEEVLLGAIGELSLPLPLHETTSAKVRPSEISVGVLLLEATG